MGDSSRPSSSASSGQDSSSLSTYWTDFGNTFNTENMAPQYKLNYFNVKGLGEAIRFILSYMEVDFEDNRIDKEQWPAIKPSMPFGKMPVLEEDGRQLHQSLAICRYLGTKAGLAGKDPWENVQIDIIADTLTDVRLPIAAFMWETNEDIKKAKKETYIKETLPLYMEKLDAIVKENGGYLANKKLSWVDILFASITEFISYATDVSDATANYPNLHALKEKIFNLPQIKKWVAKRPNTPF